MSLDVLAHRCASPCYVNPVDQSDWRTYWMFSHICQEEPQTFSPGDSSSIHICLDLFGLCSILCRGLVLPSPINSFCPLDLNLLQLLVGDEELMKESRAMRGGRETWRTKLPQRVLASPPHIKPPYYLPFHFPLVTTQ